jgi:CheY-like chemotaxis protein
MAKIEQKLRGWNVLLVDDEEDSLAVAQLLLEMAGATVVTATNGREALAAVQKQRPHFILSDLSMPEVDGWRLMFELNQNRVTSEIPVIALTAHAMAGDRDRAIQAGFVNYISKPLDPDKFLTQMITILDAIPQLQALMNNKE